MWSPQWISKPGLILEPTMRRQLLPIVLTLVLLVPQSALSWNSRGHMMVAAVAYQKLTQATKDHVDALLLLNPDRDNVRLIVAEWLGLFCETSN
jgi:hypothetical protein